MNKIITVLALTLAIMISFAGTALARVPGSDHNTGKARDIMVNSRAEGNRVAACALGLPGRTYVIWRQRISFGESWRGMGDRGGATANHFDHVHVSFGSRGAAQNGSCG